MSILQQIKKARSECRASVATCRDYPILRCGGWQLVAEHEDTEIDCDYCDGAVTLKYINDFKSRDFPEGTNFYIRGQYEAHSHIDNNHEMFEVNYDAHEFWGVDL